METKLHVQIEPPPDSNDSFPSNPSSQEMRARYSKNKQVNNKKNGISTKAVRRFGKSNEGHELRIGDTFTIKKHVSSGSWICEINDTGSFIRVWVGENDELDEDIVRKRGGSNPKEKEGSRTTPVKRAAQQNLRQLSPSVKESILHETLDIKNDMENIEIDLNLVIKAFFTLFPVEDGENPPNELVLKHTPQEIMFQKMVSYSFVPIHVDNFDSDSAIQNIFNSTENIKSFVNGNMNNEIALSPSRSQFYYRTLMPVFNLNAVSKEDIDNLESIHFDIFPYHDKQDLEYPILLLMCMFHKLGLVKTFNIDESSLFRFLRYLSYQYRWVPFHNWFHAFNVTQTLYHFLTSCDANHLVSPLEQLALLIACVCHDADHPGLNNTFQVKAKTRVSFLHKKSILENHHLLKARSSLSQPECNILKNLTPEQKDTIYLYLRDLILSTDLALHGIVLRNISERKKSLAKQYRSNKPVLEKEDTVVLVCCLIKCADLSNEIRPKKLATKWAMMVMQEFLKQSAREQELLLPITPFMDPKKIIVAKEQINFISNLCMPLYEKIACVLPAMNRCIKQMQKNLSGWRHRLKSFYSEAEVNQASEKSIWERPQAKDKKQKLSETLDKQSHSIRKMSIK